MDRFNAIDWMIRRAMTASLKAEKVMQEGRADHAALLQTEAMVLMTAAADLRKELEGAERSGTMGIKVDLGETQQDYIIKLKERMRSAGVSAAELSRTTGISPSQISRWFTTEVRPSLANIEKLERAMIRLKKRGKGASDET